CPPGTVRGSRAASLQRVLRGAASISARRGGQLLDIQPTVAVPVQAAESLADRQLVSAPLAADRAPCACGQFAIVQAAVAVGVQIVEALAQVGEVFLLVHPAIAVAVEAAEIGLPGGHPGDAQALRNGYCPRAQQP